MIVSGPTTAAPLKRLPHRLEALEANAGVKEERNILGGAVRGSYPRAWWTSPVLPPEITRNFCACGRKQAA
jgi:hypothetical protein